MDNLVKLIAAITLLAIMMLLVTSNVKANYLPIEWESADILFDSNIFVSSKVHFEDRGTEYPTYLQKEPFVSHYIGGPGLSFNNTSSEFAWTWNKDIYSNVKNLGVADVDAGTRSEMDLRWGKDFINIYSISQTTTIKYGNPFYDNLIYGSYSNAIFIHEFEFDVDTPFQVQGFTNGNSIVHLLDESGNYIFNAADNPDDIYLFETVFEADKTYTFRANSAAVYNVDHNVIDRQIQGELFVVAYWGDRVTDTVIPVTADGGGVVPEPSTGLILIAGFSLIAMRKQKGNG